MGKQAVILERLVKARKVAGLSQAQTASLVNVATNTISRLETGTYELSLPRFLQLCEVYEVSVIWMLTGRNPYFDPETVKHVAASDRDRVVELLTMIPSKHEKDA